MMARRLRSEEGASLVIVLMVIGLFGLVISGLLTESGVSVKYTKVVNDHEAKVYAADAGVSLAIEELRRNNALCPTVSSTPQTIPAVGSVNGMSLNVTCQGATGSALGANGYALIVTSPNAGALSDALGGKNRKIQGPVFVNGGVSLGKTLTISRGDFYQKAGASPQCTLGAGAPANLTVTSGFGYGYYCTSAAMPNPPHQPPGAIPNKAVWPLGHRPPTTVTGACNITIWYPGLYETPPALASGDNYFASGVYYFDFNGTFTVGQNVWFGKPSANDQPVFPLPSCAQDPTPTTSFPEVTGTGAEIVVANTANLYVSKGQAEIFTRNDPTTGTNGISFVAVPTDGTWPPGWHASQAGTTVLSLKRGNGSYLAVHGVVYAPNQDVQLYATASDKAQILGGAVASTFGLSSSASVTGDAMQVSVQGGTPVPRRILIKATAPGTSPGERPVESTAVVLIDNDFTKPPTIESWRTRGVSDSL